SRRGPKQTTRGSLASTTSQRTTTISLRGTRIVLATTSTGPLVSSFSPSGSEKNAPSNCSASWRHSWRSKMSEFPKTWPRKKLGDLGRYINGMAFKPTDWTPDGLPIIRIQNLTDPSKPFNRFAGEAPRRYLVRNGDLLISWSASLGSFIWNRGDAILNQ